MTEPMPRQESAFERRQRILNNCPFLNDFLDNRVSSNYNDWSGKLTIHLKNIREELVANFDEMNIRYIISGHLDIAKENGFFNNDYNDNIMTSFITAVLYLGYEIGNREDAYDFIPDIMGQYNIARVFNDSALTEEKLHATTSLFRGVLNRGIALKQTVEAKRLDPYKNFLEGKV